MCEWQTYLGIADQLPDEMLDALDDLVRVGAQRMLMAALEAEVAEYVERHQAERDEFGHALVVRNGGPGSAIWPREPECWRFGRRAYTTRGRTSASRARCCRRTCVAALDLRKHCRCCTCEVCRQVTWGLRLRSCLASQRAASPRQRSHG